MAIYVKNNDSIARTWSGMEIQPGEYYLLQSVEQPKWANNSLVIDSIVLDTLIISKTNDSSGHITNHSDAIDYLKDITKTDSSGYPVISVTAMPSQTPYASKTISVNGVTKKLYKRFTGISQALDVGENTFIWTQSLYPWIKFMGLEIIGGEIGDTCSFTVLDTSTGTISGIPNLPLNQFGYTVNIAKDFYKRMAEYDADVTQGLQFKFVYNSVSAKTIYLNFDMNEVKSS